MGQYWIVVNLDKKEYLMPHKLGCGLKLWEQLASHPSTGSALLILCASPAGVGRGGGDFDMEENWHGPERKFPEHNISPGPMPERYAAVAKRTIGRWAGDRIALIGDYSESGDMKGFNLKAIYNKCHPKEKQVWTKEITGADMEVHDANPESKHYGQYYHYEVVKPPSYKDVTNDVCRVIEHELNGKFSDTKGWREWKENPSQ